tara:strand:- start:8497 stop:10056 length:1560 start_codon:yes stop_codon:yes gene_type:complete
MLDSFPIVSFLVWAPIIVGLFMLIQGSYGYHTRDYSCCKYFAAISSIVVFIASIILYLKFDINNPNMQFTEDFLWIPIFDIHYSVGIDGISLPLIILTTLFIPITILASFQSVKTKITQYLALFLIMEGLMLGVFVSRDAFLFYVFWEAMLLPMYLVIGVWGGPDRIYAAIKFFLYSFLGSLLMLVALIYLYMQTNSFSIVDFTNVKIPLLDQKLIFLAFLAAFGVKLPIWPVHTWLRIAHVEAPTGGSVILAAITLKMGGYGFLRFCLPITPDAAIWFSDYLIVLSLIAIIYIGIMAIIQTDMKRLIAYSSIAHMGFVTLGVAAGYKIVAITQIAGGNYHKPDIINEIVMGFEGAMVQMISHGLISGALFLCIGVLYDRMHTRDISAYGGVVNKMPWFAALFLLFGMASSGLPGTSGFVGEFFVILTSFKVGFWITFFAATGLIFSAAYNLWLYRRVIFGKVVNDNVAKLEEASYLELSLLSVLAILVLALGFWPKPLVDVMHVSLHHLTSLAFLDKI